jgi:hypothetical protein
MSVVHIERDGGKRAEDRINVAMDGQQAKVDLPGAGNHYMVSFKLLQVSTKFWAWVRLLAFFRWWRTFLHRCMRI